MLIWRSSSNPTRSPFSRRQDLVPFAMKEDLNISYDQLGIAKGIWKLPQRQPMPRPEDLIGGGPAFTKIDLADACNQTRLPFGIKSAPGYFQDIMEELIPIFQEWQSTWMKYSSVERVLRTIWTTSCNISAWQSGRSSSEPTSSDPGDPPSGTIRHGAHEGTCHQRCLFIRGCCQRSP
jgi:hypothetical protein